MTPASIERMRRPATMLGARNGLEVGYALASTPYEMDGFTYYGHSGGIDGFVSDYGVLPEGDLGYFIGYRIAEAFYGRTVNKREALRAIIDVSNSDLFLSQSGYAP